MENIVLINEKIAAQRFAMSRAWFQRMRWCGGGPPFIKVGSAVRYHVEELEKYFLTKKRRNTSDITAINNS